MAAEKHCETCICGRRAPVQATRRDRIAAEYLAQWGDRPDRGPGTIAWAEHLEAMAGYAARYGRDQGPERMAERGGLIMFLGHEPTTWMPIR